MTMRKLILKMSISLDGFVAGPNGEINWIFPYMSKDGKSWLTAKLWAAGLHIMGSRTYRDMASYWPYSDDQLAPPMNEIPKVIFSRGGTLASQAPRTTAALKDAIHAIPVRDTVSPAALTGWTEARFATGDLATEVAALKKQEGKPIFAHGGAGFAQNLVSRGLIDEFILVVNPIALGQGLPLFSSMSKPLGMKLIDSIRFSTGVLANTYLPP